MKLWEFQDPRTGHGMTDQYLYADHVLVGNGNQPLCIVIHQSSFLNFMIQAMRSLKHLCSIAVKWRIQETYQDENVSKWEVDVEL